MTRLVPPEQIVGIVGAPRRVNLHLGRAVSAERTVYILHSLNCLKRYADLRDCPFSIALDKGIDEALWARFQDKPIVLRIGLGRLCPARTVHP